jgi:hypothetical protein
VLAGLALIGVGAFIFFSNHIDRSLQIVQFVDGDCSITLAVPNQAAVADNVSARIRLSGKACPDPKGATLYLNGVSLGTKGTAGSEGLLSGNVEGLSLRKWVLSFATPGQQLIDATISTLSHGTALLSTTVEVKPGTDLSKTTALITNARQPPRGAPWNPGLSDRVPARQCAQAVSSQRRYLPHCCY